MKRMNNVHTKTERDETERVKLLANDRKEKRKRDMNTTEQTLRKENS